MKFDMDWQKNEAMRPCEFKVNVDNADPRNFMLEKLSDVSTVLYHSNCDMCWPYRSAHRDRGSAGLQSVQPDQVAPALAEIAIIIHFSGRDIM